MISSYSSKICFIVIFNYPALAEPVVGELLPSLLPSQRAGKGACDVRGRDPKS